MNITNELNHKFLINFIVYFNFVYIISEFKNYFFFFLKEINKVGRFPQVTFNVLLFYPTTDQNAAVEKHQIVIKTICI